VDCCEHSNEPLGSIKDGECLHNLQNYRLLKNDSLPWSSLNISIIILILGTAGLKTRLYILEIPHLLLNPEVYYCVYKNPPSLRPCATFCNMLAFHGEGLLDPQLGDHPFLVVHDCLMYSQLPFISGGHLVHPLL